MVKLTGAGMLSLSDDLVHVRDIRGRPSSASLFVLFTQHEAVDGFKSITICIIKVDSWDWGLLLLHLISCLS